MLCCAGHKPSALSADLTGSHAACASLGAALAALLAGSGWAFSGARCTALRVTHKFWQDASVLGADSMYV